MLRAAMFATSMAVTAAAGAASFPLIWATDFRGSKVQTEESLLDSVSGKRKSLPTADFVLEGPNCSFPLQLQGLRIENNGDDCVLWTQQAFVNDVVIDYAVTLFNSSNGLAIAFWNALSLNQTSIFSLNLPARRGVFAEYINGEIENYRTSYFGVNPGKPSGARTNETHIRKSPGNHLAVEGADLIMGRDGPFRVTILSRDGEMAVYVDAVQELYWKDTGEWGAAFLKGGAIGLRTMSFTERVTYVNLTVHHIVDRSTVLADLALQYFRG
jgi:hypothetical protein